jgi:hypothetical protein
MSSTKKCRKRAQKVQHAQRAEARRHLSFDPLVKKIRERAEAIPDGRSRRCDFSLADAVMSAFAMFSLKDPYLKMHFLLVAKPSDHQYLFQEVAKAIDENRYTIISWHPEDQPDVLCEVGFAHDLPLNQANPDVRVNFLCYTEYGPEGQRLQITWVTDLEITTDNARHLVRGGRARWKIENETFNTLKNQGYHFEHNFGHGKKNLSVVFAMLMMLAFLIDQTQEICCGQFQAVLRKAGSRRYLWDCLRSHFRHFRFGSMWHLYEVMLHDRAKELPAPGSSLHLSGVCRTPPDSCSMSL